MSNFIKCKSNGSLLAKFKLRVPIGELEIECCSRGLHSLHIQKSQHSFPDHKKPNWDTVKLEECQPGDKCAKAEEEWRTTTYPSITNECVDYFRLFFDSHSCATSSDLMQRTPKICWRGICVANSFSEKVLSTLLNRVGPGERLSYAELASIAGNPKAQRAVGTVMRKNPIPLIVPCHRVIRSNQTIGNYNGGADIKEWLLEYEKIYFSKEQ